MKILPLFLCVFFQGCWLRYVPTYGIEKNWDGSQEVKVYDSDYSDWQELMAAIRDRNNPYHARAYREYKLRQQEKGHRLPWEEKRDWKKEVDNTQNPLYYKQKESYVTH